MCHHHNTGASIYKIFSIIYGKEFILKVDNQLGSKLPLEIEYIINNSDFSFLPNIYDSGKIYETNYYLMESFCRYENFSSLYKKDTLTADDVTKAMEILKYIESKSSVSVDSKQLYNMFFSDRLSKRIKLLQNSYLKEIIDYEYIYINGDKFQNLSYFWQSNLPKFSDIDLGKTNKFLGDFHFENIFIDFNKNIKVIDPKGAILLPLVYDTGKILHSVHGGYDTFKNLEFKVKRLKKNYFEFQYQLPKRRSDILFSINKYIVATWGVHLLKASYAAELFHFSSLIAHHLYNKKEALGFYLRTLQLIKKYNNIFLI